MGEKQELINLLNALLEAERAGVETANHLIKHYPLPELEAQYKQLKTDEAWSCAGLHKSIVREGGVPSMKVGDFIDKITTLETLEEKLKLLIKGQAWVARKIDLAISYGALSETEAFLLQMKQKHHVNIGELENYLQK
jgi:bacterioferritin (cytochrome b1)